MPQAVVKLPRRTAPGVLAKTRKTVETMIRKIMGIETIREVRTTILVPVRDSAFAPSLNCGEFAIVDTAERYPAEGLFYLAPLGAASPSIVCFRPYDPKGPVRINTEKHRGPFWEVLYGRQPVFNMAGKVINFHSWSDGYQGEEQLEGKIIGRVIGAYGDNDRALDWRA